VVIKKPGGTETVFDMSGEIETVSGIDEEKYAFHYGHDDVSCSNQCHTFVLSVHTSKA